MLRMHLRRARLVVPATALALLAAGTAVPAGTANATPTRLSPAEAAQHYTPAGCSAAPPRSGGKLTASCFATLWTDGTDHQVTPDADSPPATARTPADIQDAYHLPKAGQGQTVAIVDAFGDSQAESDLAIFRSQFGLPACTTASGCLRIVDQNGGTDLPADDAGWATETSLDLDAVSSACPPCHILLVQAASASFNDLGAAELTAAASGAVAVSNSYGLHGEDPAETSYDQYYDHKGVAIVFSSGDTGNVPNWPASNPMVTAVGGTNLAKDSGSARGWDETVWGTNQANQPGGGSGCSAYEPHPDFQDGYATECTMRATADVSADADPQTGLAVYDTLGQGGWLQVGGTSLASPLVAGAYALAGAPAPDSYPVANAYHDANQSADLFDITQGANGACGNLLCQAGPGWDGPTGLGTLNGVKALTGGPHGTLTGTVTAADTGEPVAGATVTASPGHYVTTTAADGHFTLDGVLAGDYQLSAGGVYGYQDQTASVTVTADQSTTQNFTLTGIPHETVSGTVRAGTGTAWPLYAKVSWSDGAGHGGATFTTPATGAYTLSLPQNTDYTLQVSAAYPGYQAASAPVSVGTGPATKDVSLAVDLAACTAIGYSSTATGGLSEGFDRGSLPHGWQVSNVDLGYPGYSDQPGWVLTNPAGRSNSTGGTAGFAIVDSDHYGQFHYQDTYLTSPVVDLTGAATPVVQFHTDLQPAVNQTA
ncbi:MAG: carboxypeptidase regulatory-like domain-containing protein, partial [Micromonosporaceae bacterium]|nr:carboxypeptidase regulatory-like domain-containing protein [Micromonosporaceae bacterium]